MTYVLGSSVQLKSGGPRMTVEGVAPQTGRLICSWFDGTTLKRERFSAEALRPFPEDETPTTPDYDD